jgi:hypothetical protein
METIIKTASVKVMLSYDYSHFETAMTVENEGGLTMQDIDTARKNCQRLSDKAVGQYKKAKEMASYRSDGEYRMNNFKTDCEKIQKISATQRTINEIAMLKQYEDENWESQFLYDYDYDDDDNYNFTS